MRALRWTGHTDAPIEIPARLCCYCTVPHWVTLEDRIRREAGAPVSHGMCAYAARTFEAEVERTVAEDEARCIDCEGTGYLPNVALGSAWERAYLDTGAEPCPICNSTMRVDR